MLTKGRFPVNGSDGTVCGTVLLCNNMTKKDADDQKKIAKLEELALYNSKLRFCSEQLQNLNFIFQKKLENNSSDRAGEY